MKNILVIGSFGQIGSELTPELRKRYGTDHVVAADLCPKKNALTDGPVEKLDVTDSAALHSIVKKYKIDTIYNLAAILSAVGEKNPMLAWNIGVNGMLNCLEAGRELGCAVFTPSSIAAFGPETPADQTPQDTVQRPGTMYGVTKVTGELMSDYYFKKYGVDTRSVRYPGIISNGTLPGGGTTDYAVEIYYEAIKHCSYISPLQAGTFLDMMYMPDAIDAAINLMEADPSRLKHRNSFNISAMSIDPEMIAAEIKKHIPSFQLSYEVEPVKQGIANSWPNSMDDSCARQEWNWKPNWNLQEMTADMLKVIGEKFAKGLI
ncbi:MAG: NAD-dependent epimerase/dehydratase family protein [Lentimicrobiaceae bacterium]|nr:NAD-dependent epimerase/dehydratase family protein [Lentimicrobiaceae bacterium]